MSCYGDTVVETPNIDRLAAEGVRFDRAYMTSGDCSPTRSANITGMYQTSIGAHEHYSSFAVWRGNVMEVWDPNQLGVRILPEIFKAAGYYSFNEGKFHYNFVFSADDLWNLVHSIEREHAMELARHRDILYSWILETDDKGRFPESDDALRAVIDRWGDAAVNQEYDRVR